MTSKGEYILATCGQFLNLGGILFYASVSKMRTNKHQVSILYKIYFIKGKINMVEK